MFIWEMTKVPNLEISSACIYMHKHNSVASNEYIVFYSIWVANSEVKTVGHRFLNISNQIMIRNV